MQLYSLLCWAFGSGTDTTCVNSLVSGSLYSNPTFCMQGEKFATESTLLWKWSNFRRFSHFIEKVNEKKTGSSIQKRFSRDCILLNNLSLWKNTDFKGKFSKILHGSMVRSAIKHSKNYKKNYMTPVGVSDRPKSKFWSLESYVSHLNSALSWNVKLNIFHSQCHIYHLINHYFMPTWERRKSEYLR